MAKQLEYADQLRAAFLGLSVVPVAALQAANYWFKESLERTSALATSVMTSTTLARSAQSARSRSVRSPRRPDLAPQVLARELLESSRTYVRSMINLPHDASTYFTGQMERQLGALQLQPNATTNFETYMRAELDRVLSECDRLAVFARTEVADGPRARTRGRGKLINDIEQLRDHAEKVRDKINPKAPRPDLEGANKVLTLSEARLKLQSAFQDAANLLPAGQRVPKTLQGMTERLDKRTRAILRRQKNGKEGGKGGS